MEGNPKESKYRFEVIDTGIGMTAVQLRQIFRPFVQLECGSAREYDGLGLGLTIAKRMVQRWGAGFALHGSSDGTGSGSTFAFTAPFSPAHPSTNGCTKPASELNNENQPHMTQLLLMDDDECSARCLVQMCGSLGIAVERTTSSTITAEQCRRYGRPCVFFPPVSSFVDAAALCGQLITTRL